MTDLTQLSPAAQAVLDASLLMDSALSRSMVAACWVLRKFEPEDDFRTHWLPAHTLPLPTTSRSI